MRFLILLLTIPLILSCVSVSDVEITSKTNKSFVFVENDVLNILGGDLVQISFVVNASECSEWEEFNLSIDIGGQTVQEGIVRIEPGKSEEVSHVFRVPLLDGEYFLKIRIGEYEKKFPVKIYRILGDFAVLDHKIDKENVREGEFVREKIKILNLKDYARSFRILANGVLVDSFVTSSLLFEREVSFRPVDGVNEIKVCDEESNCYTIYEYVRITSEEKVESRGRNILPYLLIPIILFVVLKVVL